MRYLKFLAATVLCLLLAPNAAALTTLDYGTHQVSIALQSGEEAAYLINMGPGDRLVVNLNVLGGSHADFYLTNLTAYNAYKSGIVGSLYFLGGQSREDSPRAQYSYDSLTANEYVLLIDNTANTEGGAIPAGPVTIEGTITVEKNIWTVRNIALTIALIIGIALFMAYLRWRRKKA